MVPAELTHAPSTIPTMTPMPDYFPYGDEEIAWLSERDGRLGYLMARIGKIERVVIPDLFEGLAHAIVGQQISTRAHETVWRRLKERLGAVTPEIVDSISEGELQAAGISFRKASYIKKAARKIASGEFNLAALHAMDDDEAIRQLSTLDGIGVWSAEMLLLFSMMRPDVLSFGDLGIRKGLCMVHGLADINRQEFEAFRALYSPYGSVASLYLWELAQGSVKYR